jgi:shikimate dehydrogenase
MIDAKTGIFCVIGDPIEHSLSPAMHNAVFEDRGLNYRYVAFRIESAGLGDAVRGFRALGIRGVNVTIPHKVAVMKHLDALSDEARIIGAVNTIKMGKGGEELTGYNTDGMGALMALVDSDADPKGKGVLILGSGGAARAIAVTLALEGGVESLTILGIAPREIETLVKDIKEGTSANVTGKKMDRETIIKELENADLLIHATPVGMHPKVDETCVTADMMHEDLMVMDVVYTPLETKLLKEAKKAGVKTTVGGIDMFVNQGAESERIWLGIDAPVDLMREVVLKGLKRLE